MNDQKYPRRRKAEIGNRESISNPRPPRICVRNLQRKITINVGELEEFAARAVQRCLQLRKGKRTDLRKLREVFIWLISDRRMALLHRKFLGKSGPTDVLTFQHGEIFISVETARRHARAFGEEDKRRGRCVQGGGNSLMRELKLYIVHGLLHLHGFDDGTPADARKMKTTQEKILRRAL